jgi:hypothetical protein
MLVYFTAIWYILRPSGIFYGHLVYVMVIWYILRSIGIFYGHLVYFFTFWYGVPGKIWQPRLAPLLKTALCLASVCQPVGNT